MAIYLSGENDDYEDDGNWKVGAWRSTTGVCKIARAWREETAARRRNGLSRQESSFESLDFRAAEILNRSMQALESSNSLTSCASGTTREYPHWGGGGGRGRGGCGWEVQKGEQEVVGRRHDWDPLQRLHSNRTGGLAAIAATKVSGFHGDEHDRRRVLNDKVNSNVDYGVRVSTTEAKTPEDKSRKSSSKDVKVLNVKENTLENDELSYGDIKRLPNGPARERKLDGGQELPTPASRDDMFLEGAGGDERTVSFGKTGNGTSGPAITLGRLTQTELTGLPGCKMLPPKRKRTADSRPPRRPKEDHLHMKINSAGSGRRRKVSWKSNVAEQRKLIFPSKPPQWKGLSTALSVIRSLCHGAGEAGVVDAQARPLLIIAGKCVFRTTAPLDTPRLCSISHQRKRPVQRAINADEESLPPSGSADVSSKDTKTASSHNQPARTSPSKIPERNKHQSTSASIKHWPATVTELDNWISQTINDWLDKDDCLAAVANSCLCDTAVTSGSMNLSSTIGARTGEEEVGVLGGPPVSNTLECPNRLSKSLKKTHEEEAGRSMSGLSSKKLTELDARIGQARSVHDLSQLLKPISQASSLPAIRGSKVVVGGVKISPMSIIQEFGEDDAVQEFQKQIQTLERENEDLKSSLCKGVHLHLLRRLEGLRM